MDRVNEKGPRVAPLSSGVNFNKPVIDDGEEVVIRAPAGSEICHHDPVSDLGGQKYEIFKLLYRIPHEAIKSQKNIARSGY